MRSRKAQVTVFLIIGIFLLMLTAGLFYIISMMQEAAISDELEEIPSTSPIRSAISLYVESCLGDTIEDGILLLGFYGGDVYLENSSNIL